VLLMARYIIREVVAYEVEADTPRDALDIFLGSEDINQFFSAAYDRWIAPSESVTYGDGGPYAMGQCWPDEDLEEEDR
jgi:hypothetical protein